MQSKEPQIGAPLFGAPLLNIKHADEPQLSPDSPTLSLKLPSSILDQDGSTDRDPFSNSASSEGSGLLSPSAAVFKPSVSGDAPFLGGVGMYGGAGVWDPSVSSDAWPAAQQQSLLSMPTRGPSVVSRSAPTTPRIPPGNGQMPYATAPVSPHSFGLTPPSLSPGRGADMYYYGAFPPAPDLVYSAPGAFGIADEDDSALPKQAEHPSRTLFVRNLANDTDPLALQGEFEQFGPVRSIYANCKYRGFVMISFFDIRHAKAAMLVLNGKKVSGKKMDVHYALPKDNPGEKESNQGTLVVFNLDQSMTDDDIREVFSEHGEVKDIRSTPNKTTHKFVEFFDVRDAEKALLALNRTKVRSKIIKIEVSRPSNRGRRKAPDQMGAPQQQPGVRYPQQQPPPQQYGHQQGYGMAAPVPQMYGQQSALPVVYANHPPQQQPPSPPPSQGFQPFYYGAGSN